MNSNTLSLLNASRFPSRAAFLLSERTYADVMRSSTAGLSLESRVPAVPVYDSQPENQCSVF